MEGVTKCAHAAKLSRKRCENWLLDLAKMELLVISGVTGAKAQQTPVQGKMEGEVKRVRTDNSFKEFFFQGKQ